MLLETSSEQEPYLLSKRDAIESNRLDKQHVFIQKILHGHLIHPEIPAGKVLNVADVATGTGAWIREISASLGSDGKTSGHFKCHGFDISDKQFPSIPPPNTTFSIQDILQPFPREHRGIYDLVHVRFLMFAIKVVDVRTAMKNVIDLLKPGGYLQWVDLEQEILIQGVPALDFSHGIPLRYAEHDGMSLQFVTLLQKTAQEAGLMLVTRDEHRPNQRTELAEGLRIWYWNAMKALAPPVWLRLGQATNDEDSKRLLAELGEEVHRIYKEGVVPDMPIVSLVLRKD